MSVYDRPCHRTAAGPAAPDTGPAVGRLLPAAVRQAGEQHEHRLPLSQTLATLIAVDPVKNHGAVPAGALAAKPVPHAVTP